MGYFVKVVNVSSLCLPSSFDAARCVDCSLHCFAS